MLALLLIGCLVGCAGDGGDRRGGSAAAPKSAGQLTATPGVVRAGICPPVGTRSPLAPDRLEAFQDELLRHLGFKLALRMRVSALPSCTRPATPLADRTLDLVATAPNDLATIRPGTLETEPYLVVQYALIVDTGSTAAGKGLGGIGAGTRLGVLAGTRGAAWARERFGGRGARLMPFAGERAAAEAAAAGRCCDALLLPRASANRTVKKVPGLRIERLVDAGERATFLVAVDNPAFRSRVDRMLEEIVYDGSYAVIFDRHLAPTPVPIDFLPPD